MARRVTGNTTVTRRRPTVAPTFTRRHFSPQLRRFFKVRQKRRHHRSPFIVNEHSPSFGEILSGLQATGRGFVIQEGARAPDSGNGTFTIKLPDNIQVRIRTTELINPDGSVELQPDSVVANTSTDDAAFNAALRALQENTLSQQTKHSTKSFTELLDQKDNSYANMEFPTVEYRLLALFRFWNVINYFFPYKKLIDDPWENVLPRYIPKFEANKDAAELSTHCSRDGC